jgi:hypothetical protein
VRPLYDRTGRVYAWLHQTGKIYGLKGENLAFVDGDSIYAWNGAHIGWWRDSHIRDSVGYVALFAAEARITGVSKPVRAVRPVRPAREVSPANPLKGAKPVKPSWRSAWSAEMPF